MRLCRQMSEYAHGVPKDLLTAAARFYERACDQGWVAGCYNFAIMLEHGRGVPTDRPKAGSRTRSRAPREQRRCVKASEILGGAT